MLEKNREILQYKAMSSIDWSAKIGEKLEYQGNTMYGEKIFCNSQGNPILIENNIDKVLVEKIDSNVRQAIFFFGLSSLQEFLSVAPKAHAESVFIIIEANRSIMDTVLACDDLSALLPMNIMFMFGDQQHFEDDLKIALYTRLLILMRKPVFYFNSYYRKHELKSIKEYITVIRNVIRDKMFRVGNDVQDSLVGLINNMSNLSALVKTKDVAWLKNKFDGVPIFVIAAGPSLEKNMHELKRIGKKGIIIAVDTIAEKMVNMGIVPDFIASVERFNVFEYFYQNKSTYFKDSYLLAPPLVQPEVLALYGEKAVLPFREVVYEYIWLADILGLSRDYIVWMGASCAHIAAGFAFHMGGAPIVLVGQDLAFGNDGLTTHASGTAYEEKPEEIVAQDEIVEAEGYYGGVVKTQHFWNHFRSLYEEFSLNSGATVINATEGGAKIRGTEQMPLSEVIDSYCNRECDIQAVLASAPVVQIDEEKVIERLEKYCKTIDKRSNDSRKHLKKLKDIFENIEKWINQKGYEKIFKTLSKTDAFFKNVMEDMLVSHNLQGQMVVLWQKFHIIPDDGTKESLKANLELQIEFCEMYTHTLWLIGQIIREGYLWPQKEEKKC